MLDNLIINYYFYLLVITFAIMVILIVKKIKLISFQFKDIKKIIWIILIIIILSGFFLRVFYVPTTHKLFNDEYAYQMVAKNFAIEQKLCENYRNTELYHEDCVRPVWAPVWPFMIYSAKFLGSNYFIPFYLNMVLGSLTILLFFLITYLITKKSTIALLGSILIAFLPTHLKFSSTIVSDVSSLFFASLSFLFLLLYFKTKDEDLFFLTIITSILTLQIKFENFIVIIGLAILFFLKNKKWTFKKKYLFAIIAALTLITLVFHSSNAQFLMNTERSFLDWMHESDIRERNIHENLDRNLQFFVQNQQFILGITLISLLGVYQGYRKDKKLTNTMLFIFVAMFFLYSNHGMGHFTMSESDRYILNMFLPILVFFVYGINFIIEKFKEKNTINILLLILAVYLIISPFKNPDFYFSKTFEQIEFDYARQVSLNKSCTIFQDEVSHALLITGNNYQDIKYLYRDMNKFKDYNCLLLYDLKVLEIEDFNPIQAYPYLNIESFKTTENIYPKGKNPFFIIHI